MEDLKETLYKLFMEELSDLQFGHSFNTSRLRTMRDICHILKYNEYVEMSADDIVKLVRF